ncbi:MAG: sterol desaturase family protein [bacterium]
MPIYVQYYFWLAAVSLFAFTLERLAPWRREQRVLRKGIWQDLFWLVFNGHYVGVMVAIVSGKLLALLNSFLYSRGLPVPESLALMQGTPLWLQFAIFLVVKDFIEWNVHRMLHIVPWLWEFHKLHHSIEELDWIGNMRFHWMEVVVYKSISYFPLAVLGVNTHVIFIIAIVNTVIGHLNHSNVPISWGPLRYILNSPKMHIWHHDVVSRSKGGQNFGITLSVWDWLFGTAYMPEDGQPDRLGFEGMESYPSGLIARLFYPFYRWLPIPVKFFTRGDFKDAV